MHAWYILIRPTKPIYYWRESYWKVLSLNKKLPTHLNSAIFPFDPILENGLDWKLSIALSCVSVCLLYICMYVLLNGMDRECLSFSWYWICCLMPDGKLKMNLLKLYVQTTFNHHCFCRKARNNQSSVYIVKCPKFEINTSLGAKTEINFSIMQQKWPYILKAF